MINEEEITENNRKIDLFSCVLGIGIISFIIYKLSTNYEKPYLIGSANIEEGKIHYENDNIIMMLAELNEIIKIMGDV